MNTEHLPYCPCGVFAWEGGGGYFGGGCQFYGRVCGKCGNVLHYVGRKGWWVVLINPADLEDATVEFINKSMAIQARAYEAVWTAADQIKQKGLYADICRDWGVDPDKGCQLHYLEDAPKYKEPDSDMEWTDYEYRDDEDNRVDIDAHAFRTDCQTMRDANPSRPGIVRAPDPLNVPDGVTAYVQRDAWDLVDPDTSSVSALLGTEDLPEDPLQVGWDKYWNEVFDAVTTAPWRR